MIEKIDPAEAKTHALNVEGVFFQQRVAHVIIASGWPIAAQEYPVAFPPGNGPILGKEGRLDIWSERLFADYRVFLAGMQEGGRGL